MVKLENGQKNKTSGMGKQAPRPQWHPSHVHLRDTSLELSRLQVLSQWVSVNFHPSGMLEYMDDGWESLEPNIFYVPEKDNKSALDLLFC